MVRIAVITATFFLGALAGFSQTVGDYRSNVAGAWSTATNWQTFDGSSWVTASSAPTGTTAGVTITISNAKTMTGMPITILNSQIVIEAGAQLTIGNLLTGTNVDFLISGSGSIVNNGTLAGTAGTLANRTIVRVDGSLTNNGTFNMNVGNFTLTVNGTFTNTGNYSISNVAANTTATINGTLRSSADINLTQATKLIFASGSVYEHLYTEAPGSIPTATWDANSTCIISGYTKNAGPPSKLSSTVFGNFIWNTPALQEDFSLAADLINVTGSLTVESTGSAALYLGRTEVVALSIGGDFSILGSSAVNITESSEGNSIIIGGSLIHSSSAVFNAASGSGAADIVIGGDLINVGAFNGGTGTLIFSSTVGQTITGTVNVGNISIDNIVGVNIEGTVNLSGSLTLNSSSIFDADGTNDSGVLTLLSTADNPTSDAQITTIPSDASFEGNVTVQRYMSGEGYRMYRYISSPVTNATVANWQDDFSITGAFTGYSTHDPSNNSSVVCGYRLGTGASMYIYNEASQSYSAYPTTSSAAPLVPGRGYSALVRNCSSPTIIDVRGPINQGDITLNSSSNPSLTYTTSGSDAAMYGYNLVGNPYPSALDWESASWIMSNISSVIAISDNSIGSLVYHYYDNAEFTGDEFIALGQAFWVRATGASPSLTFTEDVKAAPGSSYSFYRKATPVLDRLTITVTNGSITDKAFVKVNPAAKSSLDNFDGPKLDNTLFDLATLSSDNIPMAVNAVDEITCGSAVKINLKDFTAGSYKLNFQGSGLVQEYEMVLTDKYTGSIINVTTSPDYTFVVDNNAASKAANRFELTFKEKVMSLDLSVDSNVALCATESGKVKLYNPQANVSYFATLRGEIVSDTLAGGASSIEFNIPAAALAEGENTVYINAVGNCDNAAQLEQSALVQKYSAATITQVNGRTLQSNYSTGNQWYLNGLLLADTSAVLRVGEEGEYQLHVNTGSCTLSATYTLGAETFMDKIAAYPNPVESVFSIELPIEQCSVSELPIMNDVGRQVGILKLKDYGTYRTGQYDFSSTPTGLYLIRIESGTGVRHMKVLKK